MTTLLPPTRLTDPVLERPAPRRTSSERAESRVDEPTFRETLADARGDRESGSVDDVRADDRGDEARENPDAPTSSPEPEPADEATEAPTTDESPDEAPVEPGAEGEEPVVEENAVSDSAAGEVAATNPVVTVDANAAAGTRGAGDGAAVETERAAPTSTIVDPRPVGESDEGEEADPNRPRAESGTPVVRTDEQPVVNDDAPRQDESQRPVVDREGVVTSTTQREAPARPINADKTESGNTNSATPSVTTDVAPTTQAHEGDAESRRDDTSRRDPQPQVVRGADTPALARAAQVEAAVQVQQAATAADRAAVLSSSTTTLDAVAGVERGATAEAERDPVVRHVSRGLTAMVNQKGGSLQMRLTPAELGRLDVRMTVQGGRVDVQMTATNAATAALLEREMPALRASLESQGLTVERLGVAMTPESNNTGGRQDGAGDQGRGERQQEDAAREQSRGRRDPESRGRRGNGTQFAERLRQHDTGSDE